MVWRWWSGLSFPFFYFFEREREKRTREGKWLCLLMLGSKFTPLPHMQNGSALEW
jgi:hypothetical protein